MQQPVHTRRGRRRCQCIDKYMFLAIVAFAIFVAVISIAAQLIEQQITESFAEVRASTPAAVTPRADLSDTWTPSSINPVEIARTSLDFAKASATAALALFAADPRLSFHFVDTALLASAMEPPAVEAAAEAFGAAAVSLPATVRGVALSLEQLGSVQVVLRARGLAGPADVCEQQHRRIALEQAEAVQTITGDPRSLLDLGIALDKGAQAAVAAAQPPASQDDYGLVDVPRLEFLLNAWLLEGAGADGAWADYLTAAAAVVRGHLRTIRSSVTNYTYVHGAQAEMFYPPMCDLPAVLARGARHKAHDSPAPGQPTADQVLAAAEAVAVTCMRLYADPAQRHLRLPQLVELLGTEARSRSPFRPAGGELGPTFDVCGAPLRLMRSFYELYEYTRDPVYAAWAAYVMSNDARHCSLFRPAGAADGRAVVRYAAELRYLVLLITSLSCQLYRDTVGARGICAVPRSTLVSPLHHLVPLPQK